MLHKLPAVIATLIALTAVPALADDPKMKVTLLGTAGPEYFPDRLGISTLVEANGELLLFDVGRGTNQRLYQSRVNPKDIAKTFLTHLHNDYFEGLPDLWMTTWFLLGRDHGFELWGPEGTEDMVQGMRLMFGHDLKARVNQFNPIETLAIRTYIISDGLVYEKNGIKVTAFPVEHDRTVSAWTFSTMRLMLFRDGRYPRYGFPVLAEYIRPNVYPRKSNSPSGTLPTSLARHGGCFRSSPRGQRQRPMATRLSAIAWTGTGVAWCSPAIRHCTRTSSSMAPAQTLWSTT